MTTNVEVEMLCDGGGCVELNGGNQYMFKLSVGFRRCFRWMSHLFKTGVGQSESCEGEKVEIASWVRGGR